MGAISKNVNGKIWPQILAIMIGSLSSVTYGIFRYWSSPTIAILTAENHPLNISLAEASYFTVLPSIATVICAFPTSKIMDIKGRKFTLLFGSVPYAISWVLIGIGSSLWIFYLARIMSGIGDTIIMTVFPAYMGEVSTPKVRVMWGNAVTCVPLIGGLVINCVGGFLDIRTTSLIFVSIPVLFLVTFPFMPETPYYYIMRNRTEEAKTSLRWLRQKDDVEEEFKLIYNGVQQQMSARGTIADIFYKYDNRKATIIATVLRLAQQFTGINAFLMYAHTMFDEAGGNLSPNASAIICSAVLAAFSLFGAGVLEKLGRRKATFVSCIGCNVVLLLMGLFIYLKPHIDLSGILWFPIVNMFILIMFYSLGLAIIPTLMLGELFSPSVKGDALALMTILLSVCIAASTKIYQLLSSAYGLHTPFFFFAICTLFCTITLYFIMPEIKGKTLEQIQVQLKEKSTKN